MVRAIKRVGVGLTPGELVKGAIKGRNSKKKRTKGKRSIMMMIVICFFERAVRSIK